jgi:DNA-binding transcriptional MerR regulator/catechol 2,3-dioxygenase-like lactoylglutathione lyase family enzyme
MFRIRDFSRFTRISVKMLRHYDELGLLKPVSIDPGTGYRYYSSDQLPRLNRIIALKDLGFKLDQIGRLLDEDLSADEIRGMFRMRKVEIEQTLQLEQARLTHVEMRLHFLEQDAHHLKYDVVLREIAPQLVASIRQDVADEDGQIYRMFEELEAYVTQFGARAASSPLTIYYDEEYLEVISDVEVAVPIDHPIPETERIRVREIPALPLAACVIYTGGYERADEVLNTLMFWIEANGYRGSGPLREVYLRFGADAPEALGLPKAFIADQSELYVTEIQLPVEKIADSSRGRMVDSSTDQPGEKQVGQILVPVRVLKRAVGFYRDTLGMKFSFEIDNAAFFDCGGVRLMLGLPDEADLNQHAPIIYYRVDDVQSEYALLRSRGVPFEGEPHRVARMDDHDLWMCFLHDTEGNTLGLMSEVPIQ